jgi:FlaA1/EpsC-like NDP-sugar epimerase
MFNIRVREIQSIDTIFNLNFKVDTLSLVDINDLMNREPIELFDEHVMQSLIGKTVMVTGAAGSIGSEIVRKLAQHNAPKIICVDFSESALYDLQQELKGFTTLSVFNFILADVRNENRMRAIFERFQPDEIFHAAAYKHVPLMEQYPWEAVQINVMGTSSMAKLAMEFGVEKFVFISSDKAVEPTSIMGATKRLAEIMVLSYATLQTQTQFVVTRFGNVLGSNGSVVPLFKKQIQNGGPVTVTHPDMTRYFMTIAEACQLVLEASAMAQGGEVFVFDMGEPVKIADLARNMIRLSGFIPDVEIAIKYVGQRPGEKLYENLFTPSEKMQPTHHEKIMISKQQDYSIDKAESIIRRLSVLENSFDASFYQKVIKDILPEYQITSVVENTMHEVVFKVVEPV